MQTYKFFLGADVGKTTLAICVLDAHENRLLECSIKNNQEGINSLWQQLNQLPGFRLDALLSCREHTAPAARRHLLSAHSQLFLSHEGGFMAPIGGADQSDRRSGRVWASSGAKPIKPMPAPSPSMPFDTRQTCGYSPSRTRC